MAGRVGVAVAGTHGKTTTTSMLTVALQHCGLDPSFVIGGSLTATGLNAHDGTGALFIAEADESDGSFLALAPHVAIVTNVESDHVDHYGHQGAVEAAFHDFVRRIDEDGALVACADDAGSARLAASAQELTSVRTYGTADSADLRVSALTEHVDRCVFEASWRGVRLDPVAVHVPGRHNALNAAGVLATGLVLGQPAGPLIDGIASYSGTRRRFELKGSAAGVRVYDDYAHHPTEVEATLTTARVVAEGGRVVVAFQPHRYSRTAAFRREFGAALALADEVVVMEVYSAGEDPIPGATGESVSAAVPLAPERVLFEPSWSAVAGRLAERARDGDVVLTMGAGDVTMVGPEVLALLEAK
jgi:UDP-N-acetylmuramate--alanine ligase